VEEVQEACDPVQVPVHELSQEETFTISTNPMGSHTIVNYYLTTNSHVTLNILDFAGKEIELLVNKFQSRGEHKVIINRSFLPPGVYFCTLKTSEGIQTIKMIKL